MSLDKRMDNLIAYYKSPRKHPLTDFERAWLDRLWQVNCLIRTGKKDSTVVAIIMKEYGVSRATAYNDITDARRLYGSLAKPEKEFWREVLREWATENMMIAKEMGDMKAQAAAIANLIKITGVDKESPELPDFSKFEPHTYQLTVVMDGRAQILNLDKPEEIPQPIMKVLMDQLAAPQLTIREKLKMLNEPDTEDTESEIIT
jgi:hypothetical protein